jgi:hypothetical protein
MTKPKSIKFRGELKKPIEVGVLRANEWPAELSQNEKQIWDESADAFVEEKYLNECRKKFVLLFDHYQIEDKTNFELLALHLAKDFVDGFKFIEIPTKLQHGDFGGVVSSYEIHNGRPKVWTEERLLELYDDVQTTKIKENKKSDRDALLRLATSKKWSRPNTSRDLDSWIETLESRLQKAKRFINKVKNLVDLVQKIQANSQASDE